MIIYYRDASEFGFDRFEVEDPGPGRAVYINVDVHGGGVTIEAGDASEESASAHYAAIDAAIEEKIAARYRENQSTKSTPGAGGGGGFASWLPPSMADFPLRVVVTGGDKPESSVISGGRKGTVTITL